MTGGLLQLVAIGIDSIFLTSNPSITLFKCVYRRHSNFSLTQRTKQILNISDFGQNGQYDLQKEGDLIHKVWLNINISNYLLQYPFPTNENVTEILNKYGLNIDISNNIVTYNEYQENIIPKILNQINIFVNEFNNYDILINKMLNFLSTYNIQKISFSDIYNSDDLLNNKIDENLLKDKISQITIENINKLISDMYYSFKNYNITNDSVDNVNNINDLIYLILFSYLKDISIQNNNINNKIYTYQEINDFLYIGIVEFLIGSVGGYQTNQIYSDKTFYDSYKLLYLIQISLDNVDISKYNGYSYLNYFIKRIEEYKSYFNDSFNFTQLENYYTLQKFLNTYSDTLYINSKNFTDEFKILIINTLVYNAYNNIDIIYNVILNLVQNNTHNNSSSYRVGYFKTFTNTISDTDIFTTTLGNNLYGLTDNLLNLFTKYNSNQNQSYQIFFANDIVNNIIKYNNIIKNNYDNEMFIGYFQNLDTFTKIKLGSISTNNILSNLTLISVNPNIYNITNKKYYWNVNSYVANTQPYNQDIYTQYITNLDQTILKNICLLNYIPLHTIRDIATEIYNEFSIDPIITDIVYFDYRDFDQYNPTTSYNQAQTEIYNNQQIKNNLYQQFIFNILLQKNNNSDQNIYNNFGLFNEIFLNSLYTNYGNTTRILITGLLQPENLFTFTYNNGNTNKTIKLSPISAIIETYRYNIMQNFINSSNYTYIYNKLDNILSRYNIFKNTSNLNNPIYSYNSYVLNGYTFTDIETNNSPQAPSSNIYVQALSSIWNYIYQQMIRNYNSLFNNVLISDDYYLNNLGNNYVQTYNNIRSNLSIIEHYFDPSSIEFAEITSYYSYDISQNKIYFYDENVNSNYPIVTSGFDYYSFGDTLQLENPPISDKINLSSIYNPNTTKTFLNNISDYSTLQNQFNNLSGLTPIDKQYVITRLKFGYNISLDKVNYINLTNSFKSSLFTLLIINIPFDYTLTLQDLINMIKDKLNINQLSPVDQQILNNLTLDNTEYKIFGDILIIIKNIILEYTNPINNFSPQQYPNSYKMYNILNEQYKKLIDNINPTFVQYYFDNLLINLFNNPYIINLYNSNYDNSIFNQFNNGYNITSDLLNYCINTIVSQSEYNFIYDMIDLDYVKMIINIFNNLVQQKYKYLKLITNITIPTDPSNPITIQTKSINFKEYIPYLNYLYLYPNLFIDQTDIIYYGSEFNSLLENIILQKPVKNCWVPELGFAMLQDLTFNLDKLLIDEYDCNLLSLLKKIEIPYDQYRGLDKLIGNTPELITYDEKSKGNLHLYIPLNFYFCKESRLSLPMTNLLYTIGSIQFKLKKIEELLIYDHNAKFIIKPKLKCNMLVQYIYLEDDERKKISISKMEFLIEKFKYAGTFTYNYKNLIEGNILRTKLRIADPTKYIVWRFRVRYNDFIENYFKWNINGYYDKNNNPIKTTKKINVYFNGQIRDNGPAELFNTIINYGRLLGSMNNDEYLYSFALFPLMYQPSGAANLSQIEDVIIEHELTQEFIDLMKLLKLTIDIEFWGFGYNVIRMVSGMAAPLFYC